MAKVKVIDRGWKAFEKNMRVIKGSFVKVGLPSGFNAAPGESDASEILVIGATQEFGTNSAGKNHNITIPERSYMRSSFDENRVKLNRVVDKAYSSILLQRATVGQALGRLGLFAASKVKKKIRDLRTPPNKPSTIAKKGSMNPLIDTGQLVQSITHEVTIR